MIFPVRLRRVARKCCRGCSPRGIARSGSAAMKKEDHRDRRRPAHSPRWAVACRRVLRRPSSRQASCDCALDQPLPAAREYCWVRSSAEIGRWRFAGMRKRSARSSSETGLPPQHYCGPLLVLDLLQRWLADADLGGVDHGLGRGHGCVRGCALDHVPNVGLALASARRTRAGGRGFPG